jgi:hypothetical protein
LEDIHSSDLGLAGFDRGLDANPLEYLELMHTPP